MNHTICLAISYQGDAFKGIQKQKSVQTVSELLENAIYNILQQKTPILIAGRTDANVHATRQIISFTTKVTRPKNAYLEGANNFLPPSIRIQEACIMPNGFHPRFDAIARRYVYLIHKNKQLPAHWSKKATPLKRIVNIDKMQNASKHLLGTHDFSSFRAAGCQSISTIRDMHNIQFHENSSWIMMSIEANAFLYRMVRKITQSLLNVGSGYWSEDQFINIFHQKNGSLTTPAPPDGLYLTNITYPEIYQEANRKTLCWLEEWLEGTST